MRKDQRQDSVDETNVTPGTMAAPAREHAHLARCRRLTTLVLLSSIVGLAIVSENSSLNSSLSPLVQTGAEGGSAVRNDLGGGGLVSASAVRNDLGGGGLGSDVPPPPAWPGPGNLSAMEIPRRAATAIEAVPVVFAYTLGESRCRRAGTKGGRFDPIPAYLLASFRQAVDTQTNVHLITNMQECRAEVSVAKVASTRWASSNDRLRSCWPLCAHAADDSH